MGRKKIDIEYVKDRDARYVTFSKRKNGLFKKASELSILCGARVGVAGFTPGGNPFAFGSPTFQGVANEYLHELEGNNGEFEVEGSSGQNGNITRLNRQLGKVNNELKVEVDKVDKGKDSNVLDDLELEGLQKARDSLKVFRGEIQAASSLLLLAKKPVRKER